jgi:hypothetical protein
VTARWAIEFGHSAHQPPGFEHHVEHIDQGARTDRRHDGNALRRVEDQALRSLVQRSQDFHLREPQKVSAVHDLAVQFRNRTAACGCLSHSSDEQDKIRDSRARCLGVVILNRFRGAPPQRLDGRETRQRIGLANQDDDQRARRKCRHAYREPAEPVVAGEEVADQPFRPKANGQGHKNADRAEEQGHEGRGVSDSERRGRRQGVDPVDIEDVELGGRDDGILRIDRAGTPSGRHVGFDRAKNRLLRLEAECSRLARLCHAR